MGLVDPPRTVLPIEISPAEPEYKRSTGTGGHVKNHAVVDVVLRGVLFATALVAIIVMVKGKQTTLVPVAPGLAIPMDAKFNQLPAFM